MALSSFRVSSSLARSLPVRGRDQEMVIASMATSNTIAVLKGINPGQPSWLRKSCEHIEQIRDSPGESVVFDPA